MIGGWFQRERGIEAGCLHCVLSMDQPLLPDSSLESLTFHRASRQSVSPVEYIRGI